MQASLQVNQAGVRNYFNNAGMNKYPGLDVRYSGNGSASASIPSGVAAVYWTAYNEVNFVCTSSGTVVSGVHCTGAPGTWWLSGWYQDSNIKKDGTTAFVSSGISIINRHSYYFNMDIKQ